MVKLNCTLGSDTRQRQIIKFARNFNPLLSPGSIWMRIQLLAQTHLRRAPVFPIECNISVNLKASLHPSILITNDRSRPEESGAHSQAVTREAN